MDDDDGASRVVPMKVGQVTHLHRPSIGGIENYVHRLNDHLRESGHDVTTYTTDMSLADDSPYDRDPDAVYCDTTVAPLRNPFSLGLHRAVGRSDEDVYHLHSPYFLTSLEAAHAIPDGRPTVMTVHGTLTDKSPTMRVLRRIYKPFAGYVFDRVDHSFVQGPTERDRLLDRYGLDSDEVTIVPNGIDTQAYDVEDGAVEAFHDTYGIDPSTPTVLYVSRLIPEKNPGVFVDAVTEHLGDREMQAVLIGSGDDGFVAELEDRADDRVVFLENLPFDDVKAAYHAADVFVFLGTWEGLPTVILEAMNGRLPIVSTTVGEVPHYLDGDNGVLLDSPPSPSAVADAVAGYLDEPERADAVGERNRADVRANHEWRDMAAAMAATYDEVVEG